MKRRDALKLAAASGVAFTTPFALSSDVAAEPYGGPFLVVFNASGGWDTTYLMDPKGGRDPMGTEINRLYGPGDILSQGAIRFAPTRPHIVPSPYGAPQMSNEDFFAEYASQLLVIHGIDTSQNNHQPCQRFMATGELDSLAYPTLPALLAATRAPDAPLGFLTFGNYSATGGIVAQTRLPYIASLTRLANVDYTDQARMNPFVRPEVAAEIERTLADVEASGHSLPRVANARSFIHSAQLNSQALDRIVPYIPTTTPMGRLQPQIEIALAAFKSGLGVAANLDIAQFDSHATNDNDQMQLIPEFLAGVHYLMQRAADEGLVDQLVVVIQSEMGRTPFYNDGDGKDHWSINSWMAMGRGIPGNRVVGRTFFDPETMSEQSPGTVDPMTLAEREGGARIRPQHVHQALRVLFEVDTHPLSARFPLDIAAGEEMPRLLTG